MFDLIKFIRPDYLFDVHPFTTPDTIKLMLVFFSALIIIAIAVKIYSNIKLKEKFQQHLSEKIFSFFLWLGVIGIGLTWLRYERVQILSSRFWLIIWLIIALTWIYPIAKYWIKVVPEAKKRSEEKKQYQKYLPKKS